jgi:hypothetical protein
MYLRRIVEYQVSFHSKTWYLKRMKEEKGLSLAKLLQIDCSFIGSGLQSDCRAIPGRLKACVGRLIVDQLLSDCRVIAERLQGKYKTIAK